MVTALTLAPALLTLLGEKLDRRKGAQRRESHNGWWARHVGRVTRRPMRWTVGSIVLLGVLTAPLAALELGEAHPSPLAHQKSAFAVVQNTFGSGALTPATLVVQADDKIDDDLLGRIDSAIDIAPGVVTTGRTWYSADGTVVAQEVLTRGAPGEPSANQAVNTLRDSIFGAISDADAGVKLQLTGATAGQADLADRVVARLPLFAGAVLLASLLVLACAFRSVIVPLKAVAVTMLSVGASCGVVVCVVQWGWLRSLVGLHSTQPISAYVPMFLIAIVLGLSMDYEVFLIARIREHYVACTAKDTKGAVVRGTAGTAHTITAAAAIMVSVFLAFTLSPSPAVKVMGLGLAVAVALDATVVRMVLVPASMALMGRFNWWMPRWLDKVLPKLHVAH
jgi:RND superfamily putative drug exporter